LRRCHNEYEFNNNKYAKSAFTSTQAKTKKKTSCQVTSHSTVKLWCLYSKIACKVVYFTLYTFLGQFGRVIKLFTRSRLTECKVSQSSRSEFKSTGAQPEDLARALDGWKWLRCSYLWLTSKHGSVISARDYCCGSGRLCDRGFQPALTLPGPGEGAAWGPGTVLPEEGDSCQATSHSTVKLWCLYSRIACKVVYFTLCTFLGQFGRVIKLFTRSRLTLLQNSTNKFQ
jgi:hypothetical protein